VFALLSYNILAEHGRDFSISQVNITNTQTTVKHELFQILVQGMAKFTSEIEHIPFRKLNGVMDKAP